MSSHKLFVPSDIVCVNTFISLYSTIYNKISLKSKLSLNFIANVHYLLYFEGTLSS